MSRDEKHALQSERLVRLVSYVYDRVPFYRAKMEAAGVLPGDIRGIDDIAALPFTTKDDLRENYPFGLFAVPHSEIVRIHASSGTTGKATVVGYTAADLDIWAECVARCLTMAGVAKETRDSVMITLGTGVGGGIIIDGKVYSGSNFAGGELGHTVIVVDGRPCTCGRKGCWETYASATGLIKTTKEHMADAPKDSPLWTIVEGDINKVNGRTAFDAMRAGDPNGKAAVDEYIKYLSVGLADMVNIFQPAILCIGGGICNEGETLLAPVREYVAAESYGRNPENRTKICKAALGNDAGIIGAALLGKQGD